MAKVRDYPIEVRDFVRMIDSFSGYYDYDIFADFIDYAICCLRYHGDQETVDRLKSKYRKEYDKFAELWVCFLRTQQQNLGKSDQPEPVYNWFDTLGTIYEEISSRSKRSGLGQFFTPATVCDLNAQMMLSDVQQSGKTEGLRVNDCACGSGRLLLAFHCVAPGNELYGEDLDSICTKMATINLAIHGCKGEVCNMDSLDPSDWRWGYVINPYQRTMLGIPHIFPIKKEQSFTWRHWEERRVRHAMKQQSETLIHAKVRDEVEVTRPALERQKDEPGEQLTLF